MGYRPMPTDTEEPGMAGSGATTPTRTGEQQQIRRVAQAPTALKGQCERTTKGPSRERRIGGNDQQ